MIYLILSSYHLRMFPLLSVHDVTTAMISARICCPPYLLNPRARLGCLSFRL